MRMHMRMPSYMQATKAKLDELFASPERLSKALWMPIERVYAPEGLRPFAYTAPPPTKPPPSPPTPAASFERFMAYIDAKQVRPPPHVEAAPRPAHSTLPAFHL